MPIDRPLAGFLSLTWDAQADAAYLSLRPAGPAHVPGPTLLVEPDPAFPGLVALDFSVADGRVVGFEFLGAWATLPVELLAAAERIDGRHLERVMEMRFGGRLPAGRPPQGRPTRA